jgi:hypothetical protein
LLYVILVTNHEQEYLLMKPILLEVIAPMLSNVEMSCRPCRFMFDTVGIGSKQRRTAVNEYPEDWRQAVGSLSDWIRSMTDLYRHRLQIRVIDAQSPLGLWMQLRHRLFRFPAFVVDKKRTYIGWDTQQLEALIDERIHAYT